MLTPRDQELAHVLKARLQAAAGPRLRRVTVYGSRARGEAGQDSDFDVLVLVDRQSRDVDLQLSKAAYEVMYERNFEPVISIHVMEESNFQEGIALGFSFYRNVAREGVVV